MSFAAAGSGSAPPSPLAKGVYFWRLHGMTNDAAGTETSPVWEFNVGGRSAPVNASWGTVPDVNGDGYADVLVGALSYENTTGVALVYLGGDGGLVTTSQPALINSPTTPAMFGCSVASAGDVNGDGFADAIVGAWGVDQDQGAAYLYMGSSVGLGSTPVTLSGPMVNNGLFGNSVAGVGDINGDGFADVIIGAQLLANVGGAYLYLGGPTGLSVTPLAIASPSDAGAGVGFGAFVASAGDVNGDGFADAVVDDESARAFYLYLGSATGLIVPQAPTPFISPEDGGVYGSVGCGGDLNGDGFADVVVGSSNGAYVYFGGTDGLSATRVAFVNLAGDAGAVAVSSASGAGDVNGDGFDDLVLGADFHTGAAYVSLGSASFPATSSGVILNPPDGTGNFGYSVAGAGDIDGDGYDDLVAGAPSTQLGGSAYVYFGGDGGIGLTPAVLSSPENGGLGISVAMKRGGSPLRP
jgi:hypothetical protein